MIKAKAFSNYIKNSEFETTKVFERENIPMARPTENILPHTQPTEFSKNEKGHVPDDPDPEPSSPGSSSKKNKRANKKKRRKHRKDDSSDPSSSDDFYSSDDSDYRRKQCKR